MQEKLERFAPEFYGVQVQDLICAVENEIAPSWAQLNDIQLAQLQELRVTIRKRLSRN
jgi:hypothetical protein